MRLHPLRFELRRQSLAGMAAFRPGQTRPGGPSRTGTIPSWPVADSRGPRHNPDMSSSLTPGECAQLACILEATARKPGNVTRFVDFDDLTYLDFVLSAAAMAPVMERAAEVGVGRTVLDALRATQRLVAGNSNLGMLLLLAPLAAVPAGAELETGVASVLDRLTIDDSRTVFAAIRLA